MNIFTTVIKTVKKFLRDCLRVSIATMKYHDQSSLGRKGEFICWTSPQDIRGSGMEGEAIEGAAYWLAQPPYRIYLFVMVICLSQPEHSCSQSIVTDSEFCLVDLHQGKGKISIFHNFGPGFSPILKTYEPTSWIGLFSWKRAQFTQYLRI